MRTFRFESHAGVGRRVVIVDGERNDAALLPRPDMLTMDVTPVDPAEQQALGKFLLHVSGRGFTIGAMTWDMRIGDEYSNNELFIGYGNAKGATGFHYAGLGKISVAATPHGRP